jgi:hypothetical protein
MNLENREVAKWRSREASNLAARQIIDAFDFPPVYPKGRNFAY